jgi:hypothetical protein
MLLRGLLLGLVLVLFAACGAKSMPDDLQLTYQEGPAHKERGPQVYVSITPYENDTWIYQKGEKVFFKSKKTGGFVTNDMVSHKKILSKEQMQVLFTQLIEQKFDTMKPLYKEEGVQDGDVRSLIVTSGDVEKRVNVIEMQVDAFDAIVQSISALEK